MTKDKRQHERLSFEGNIFIEKVSSDAQGESAAEVVVCKTADISHSGIRVGVNLEFPMGAILQVGVELAGEDHTLYLVGEVRWCIPSADDDEFWLVGFRLLDANDSDIDAWREHLATMDGVET